VSAPLAKMSAFAVVALAIIGTALLFGLGKVQERGGTEVHAAFEDAYPLLEGMNVRLYGAVGGRVGEIELGEDGNAHVTMQLFDGTEPPRADAVVSIRQEDITGDSYVSLVPGDDEALLGDEEIPVSRTSVAPRFDDLLNSFNEPVRQGLELLLVELGITLESRGQDLNSAVLQLRPAFEVANDALGEVESQNEALKSLIVSAERITRQAADRSDRLTKLVDGLAATVQTTASHAAGLDAGIQGAPPTLRAAAGTLGRLTRLADGALPLANTLEQATPDLVETAALLGPFLEDAEAIIADVDPTLALVAESLDASLPALEANPKRALTAPFDLAAAIGGLLDSLLGDPTLLKSLFSAETYGGVEPGDNSDDIGLGAVAVETGNQPGYPSGYDRERHLIRSVAIPSCEVFGVPIRPGCLLTVLDGLLREPARGDDVRSPGAQGGPGDASDADAGGEGGQGPQAPGNPLGQLEDELGLDLGLGEVGENLNQTLEELGLSGQSGGGQDPKAVEDLLDFLLGS